MIPNPTPIADYLAIKNNYLYASYRIRNGVGYYLDRFGNEVEADEWEAANPAPGLIKLTKNSNIDTTSNWLMGE